MPVDTPVTPEEASGFARYFAKAQRERVPMSWTMVGKALSRVLQSLGQVLREEFTVRDTRIGALEARLQGLEGKSLVAWGDDYEPGKVYFRDQAVRKNGNIWRVLKTTSSEPGTSPEWQLWIRRSPKDHDRG